MPIATSIKKDEKPITLILDSLRKKDVVLTRRSVLVRLKKCVSITQKDTTESKAVARLAPYNPMLQGNTKNQSPKTLKTPPDRTAAVARAGSLSLRRNAASITGSPKR